MTSIFEHIYSETEMAKFTKFHSLKFKHIQVWENLFNSFHILQGFSEVSGCVFIKLN